MSVCGGGTFCTFPMGSTKEQVHGVAFDSWNTAEYFFCICMIVELLDISPLLVRRDRTSVIG